MRVILCVAFGIFVVGCGELADTAISSIDDCAVGNTAEECVSNCVPTACNGGSGSEEILAVCEDSCALFFSDGL